MQGSTQHRNGAGTVGDELDNVLTDSDPSHYFGLDAAIDINKTPDVAVVDIGAPHTFEIAVTNTSNVDLTDVEVTDPITPSCDRVIGAMAPGEVVSYTCDVASVTGFINNIASVTGIAPDGSEVSDSDPAAVTIVEPAAPRRSVTSSGTIGTATRSRTRRAWSSQRQGSYRARSEQRHRALQVDHGGHGFEWGVPGTQPGGGHLHGDTRPLLASRWLSDHDRGL